MNRRSTPCRAAFATAASLLLLLGRAPARAEIRATASSVQDDAPGCVAQNAADGDPGTRWSSAFSDDEWLLLDLGTTQDFVGLELRWEAARAKAYDVLVSPDGKKWVEVCRNASGEGSFDDLYFGRQSARFVKLAFRERATSWGYSLWEVKLKGPEEERVVRASSSATNSGPGLVVDGRPETMWRSAGTGEQWVEVDLGRARPVGGVALDWGDDFATAYRVEVSTDGETWRAVDEERQGRGGREERRFNAPDVRYLRVACTRGRAAGYALREVGMVDWEKAALESGLDKAHGLVGVDGCAFKVHTGRDGSFAPEPWPFQVSFWVYDRAAGTLYTPETLKTDWRLDDGRLPISIVTWRGTGLVGTTTVFSRKRNGKDGLITFARAAVRNLGSASRDVDLYVVVRPSPLARAQGNRGGQEAAYDGVGWVSVDGKPALLVSGGAPAEDPLSWSGVTPLAAGGKVTAGEEGARAAVVLRQTISADGTAYCDVVVPSGEGAAAEAEEMAGLGYEENLDAVRQYWRASIPMILQVPDREYADCFYSSLYYLLLLKTGDELRPGPQVYRGFFLHDAVEMMEALDRAGRTDAGRATIDRFQYKEGGGYLDELGGSLYAPFAHCLLAGDTNLLREVYPRIAEGCQLLKKLRAQQLTPEWASTDCRGLLPPSMSQDNFTKPAHLYVDNWWGLVGLRAGVLAAKATGHDADAKWMESEYQSFRNDVLTSLARVMKRERVQYMPGFADNWPAADRVVDQEHRILGDTQMAWAHRAALCPGRSLGIQVPLKTFRKSYERYWEQAGRFSGYDGGWFVEYEKVFWGYNVLLARPPVYLGMKDVALKSLAWSLEHQSCPGAWMEAMPSRVNEQGLREIAPGIVGDMPHGWCAAHYALVLRDMLLYEELDRLVLLSCVPESWLGPAGGIVVRNARTFFGTADLEAGGLDDGRLRITLNMATPPPRGYVLDLPRPAQVASVQFDGHDVPVAPGGRVEVPPATREILVNYAPAR